MKIVFMSLLALFVGSLVTSADVTNVGAERAALQLKKKPEIVVIDLRTPKEFKEGHIQGAINIDVKGDDFAKKLGKLDRKKTYLMHCRSGGRSSASLPVWKSLGFKKVLHLTSGTMGWEKAGQKLVVAKPQAAKK